MDEYQRDGSVLVGRNVASNVNQLPTELSVWLPALGVMILGAVVMWAVMRMEGDVEEQAVTDET